MLIKICMVVLYVFLLWGTTSAAIIKGTVKGVDKIQADAVKRHVILLNRTTSASPFQMADIDETGQFVFSNVPLGKVSIVAVETVKDPVMANKYPSAKLNRRSEEADLIVSNPEEIIIVTLTFTPPPPGMFIVTPAPVESVTFEVMEKYFPVILEDMAILIEYDKQRNPIEKSTKDDLAKDRMRADLWQVKRERQEELLRKYGITHEDLQRWRPAVWDSPLKEKYFDLYPEMRKKYEKITRPVKPVPLENRDSK